MDPRIASRFNASILAAAMDCYNTEPSKATALDGFESFIYEFERPDGQFILRLGHSSRRSEALIHGEVEWINYLAANGVTVARAILSTGGRLVEPVEDGQGGQFLGTAFVKAPGGPVHPQMINERLFRAYGRLLGKMHALAKTYVPSNPAWTRYAWDSPINNTIDRQLPPNDKKGLEIYQRLFAHLQSLPRDAGGYGLIHQDAHPGNFFVDEDYTITLFDFDDCVYGHFIYDLAMVVFYVSLQEKDPVEFMSRFLPVFLSAYREENRLDPCWLKEIPAFLKYREIDLFAAILFAFGESPSDPWCARFLQGRRERIENDVPFLEFDWESMAKYL